MLIHRHQHVVQRSNDIFWRSSCLITLLICISACSQTPDQAQIEQQLDSIIEAIEDGRPRAIMNKLDERFSGPNNTNKGEIYRFIVASLLRYKNISVLRTERPDVDIQGKFARVNFEVTLTAGNTIIPRHLQRYQINTGWQKKDDEWLMLEADWTAR